MLAYDMFLSAAYQQVGERWHPQTKIVQINIKLSH